MIYFTANLMAERCYKNGPFKRRKKDESEKAFSQSLENNLRLENFLVTTCTEENVPKMGLLIH